ncbi:helix-turn-helix domain-containing protein [Bifidobacterium miconisargentati]|uniref:helix-turn-helix domain-containing protein n=1 Tax=Bifidobacterium miconisargentati TaxID=2834437 RepID=UPI001BDC6809|nr:helix-turn-helix domain-containing protein [Bifidobacterium miconisargentati]MBW3090088.1 helix-turn-helix domain-containing protein [Bifidobacterium miconisargentati]
MADKPPAEKTYSVEEVAQAFHVNEETVRRWIRHGYLHAYKASNKTGYRITEKGIRSFSQGSSKYRIMGKAVISTLNDMADALDDTTNELAENMGKTAVQVAEAAGRFMEQYLMKPFQKQATGGKPTIEGDIKTVKTTELRESLEQQITQWEHEIQAKETLIRLLTLEVEQNREKVRQARKIVTPVNGTEIPKEAEQDR